MARVLRCSLFVGCLASLTATGCASTSGVHERQPGFLILHARMESTSESSENHQQRIARILGVDRRLLADDLDLFYQTERSTRLSRWHGR